MVKFKSLDLVSKRILVISLSISALLLSASLLIFAAKPANAQTPAFSSRMDDGRRYDAIACHPGTGAVGYYFIWNTQTGTFKQIYNTGANTGSTETYW